MTLVTLLSLKTMESLENLLQPYSGATPLLPMKAVYHRSLHADAWCKRNLRTSMHSSRMRTACRLTISRGLASEGGLPLGRRGGGGGRGLPVKIVPSPNSVGGR